MRPFFKASACCSRSCQSPWCAASTHHTSRHQATKHSTTRPREDPEESGTVIHAAWRCFLETEVLNPSDPTLQFPHHPHCQRAASLCLLPPQCLYLAAVSSPHCPVSTHHTSRHQATKHSTTQPREDPEETVMSYMSTETSVPVFLAVATLTTDCTTASPSGAPLASPWRTHCPRMRAQKVALLAVISFSHLPKTNP